MPDDKTFLLGELVRRAMQTSYGMIAREAMTGFQNQATVEALVELLVKAGVIDAGEFAALRERAADRISREREGSWDGPNITVEDTAQPDVVIDCRSRHAACGAACCTLYRIVLTEAEVRAGKLVWDLAAPYELPRAADGRCANLDPATLQCAVWDNRPHVCRRYDCSSDRDVWKDFDNVVPTERVLALTRIMRR
jgi:uncharacterized protein